MATQRKRVALVIGNGAYRHATSLTNPENAAEELAEALTRIGFSGIAADGRKFSAKLERPGVTALTNLEYNSMRRALAAFGRATDQAEQAIVYFGL